MMTTLNTENMDKLIKGNYLKPITKPCPDCSYYSIGDLTENGVIACRLHGDIEHPAPLK